jgi:hypothetical protein
MGRGIVDDAHPLGGLKEPPPHKNKLLPVGHHIVLRYPGRFVPESSHHHPGRGRQMLPRAALISPPSVEIFTEIIASPIM